MSKKIYIVEVSNTNTAVAQFTIAAASSAAAKAFVARQFIEARMAEPLELIGIGASSVIDADTGHPVGAQLAAALPELPLAVLPTDVPIATSVWPERMDAVDLR